MTATEMSGAMTASWIRLLLWVAALVAWSAFILVGLVLLGTGLDRTFLTGGALESARVGKTLILVGSVALVGAAVWARLMHAPIWSCALVAAPAVLVGGLTLFFGGSLFPHLSALVTFPVALAGLVCGLVLARPLLRAGSAGPSASVDRQESD